MEQYVFNEQIREAQRRAMQADIEHAINELYSKQERKTAEPDAALFERYVWSGLHLAHESR